MVQVVALRAGAVRTNQRGAILSRVERVEEAEWIMLMVCAINFAELWSRLNKRELRASCLHPYLQAVSLCRSCVFVSSSSSFLFARSFDAVQRALLAAPTSSDCLPWTLIYIISQAAESITTFSSTPTTTLPHIHIATMRVSSSLLLALPALALAEEQVPLMEKVKGFFNKATAAVSSAIPAVPSAPVEAAAGKAASKAAEAIQHTLTVENWREVLTVDPTASTPTTQEWLVFITGGNNTCFGLCANATKAWNVRSVPNLSLRHCNKITDFYQASLPVLAAKPNAPKFAYLNCEVENILCNMWSVGAPSLYHFSIPKPMADQSAPVPLVRYRPLNRTSTTTETFKTLIVDNEIEKVEPYEGFFHPFNGDIHKYGLALPYAYITWGFSKMPSWLPMIAISFLSRSFM